MLICNNLCLSATTFIITLLGIIPAFPSGRTFRLCEHSENDSCDTCSSDDEDNEDDWWYITRILSLNFHLLCQSVTLAALIVSILINVFSCLVWAQLLSIIFPRIPTVSCLTVNLSYDSSWSCVRVSKKFSNIYWTASNSIKEFSRLCLSSLAVCPNYGGYPICCMCVKGIFDCYLPDSFQFVSLVLLIPWCAEPNT